MAKGKFLRAIRSSGSSGEVKDMFDLLSSAGYVGYMSRPYTPPKYYVNCKDFHEFMEFMDQYESQGVVDGVVDRTAQGRLRRRVDV